WPHQYLFMLRLLSVEEAGTAFLALLSANRPQESRAFAKSISVPFVSFTGRSPHDAHSARSYALLTQEGSLFPGDRIDNSTACFVSSGGWKLSAISFVAKRFFAMRHQRL